MKVFKVRRLFVFLLGATLLLACETKPAKTETATAAVAKEPLRIWWAQWAPADGLQQLSREFTKETGIEVKVHQIPWPKFQDQVFQEFGRKKTSFDIVVGDSQWLGRGATKGLYVDLSEWLPTAVDLESTHPKALKYLAEYPGGSGRYWAAPAETDAVGFAYRADWFADTKEQQAFKTKFSRDLAPPKTWAELRDIASFFHRPGEKKYGVAMLTGRGYDEIAMGFQQFLYAFGGSWGDFKTKTVKGHLDNAGAVKALDFFKELTRFSPPGGTKFGYGEVLEPLQNGTVAMAMNYFAFFPTLSQEMGDKVGFFATPRGDTQVASLGGQGFSISKKTSPAQQESAKKFIEWFMKKETQDKWVKLPGGFTANAEILKSDSFKAATPYNAAFSESMDVLQDFWNHPSYNELLYSVAKNLGEVLDGSQTSKEALTKIAAEHEKVLAQP